MSLDVINILKGLAYSQLEVPLHRHSSKMKELDSHNRATSTNKKYSDKSTEEKMIVYNHKTSSTFWECIALLPIKGNANSSFGLLAATSHTLTSHSTPHTIQIRTLPLQWPALNPQSYAELRPSQSSPPCRRAPKEQYRTRACQAMGERD